MKCPDSDHKGPLFKTFKRGGDSAFVSCSVCGLAFRKAFPSPEELKNIYREAYSTTNILVGDTEQESGNYAVAKYAEFLVQRFLSRDSRVLDVGAGSGAFVEYLRNLGIAADGLEFSAAAREYSLSRRSIKLAGRFDELSSAAYDMVTMIEVIEHVTELWGTLVSVHKVLKPGGVLFLTTPNLKGWRARLEGARWREAGKEFHLFLFDRESMIHHLHQNGFKNIKLCRFTPIAKAGLVKAMFGRLMQIAGFGGTLSILAQRK